MSNSPSLPPGVNKAAMDLLIQRMKTVDPLTDYFQIPTNLDPAWLAFYEKVLAFGERQCASNPQIRIAWEKRGMLMEDHGKIHELVMFVGATEVKATVRYLTCTSCARTNSDSGPVAGKFLFQTKGLYYINQALFYCDVDVSRSTGYAELRRVSPQDPKVCRMIRISMLLLTLKSSYDAAESRCNNALDTRLITKSGTFAKAYFRRAKARKARNNVAGAFDGLFIYSGIATTRN